MSSALMAGRIGSSQSYLPPPWLMRSTGPWKRCLDSVTWETWWLHPVGRPMRRRAASSAILALPSGPGPSSDRRTSTAIPWRQPFSCIHTRGRRSSGTACIADNSQSCHCSSHLHEEVAGGSVPPDARSRGRAASIRPRVGGIRRKSFSASIFGGALRCSFRTAADLGLTPVSNGDAFH